MLRRARAEIGELALALLLGGDGLLRFMERRVRVAELLRIVGLLGDLQARGGAPQLPSRRDSWVSFG